MNDLISVIVPVYNVEKYLNRCVESIVNQSYKNIEIILINDGSTDNSRKICDSWSEKDSRIKVIHKKNGGVSSARNTGLDAAMGKYICFVDSDDFVKPEMVAQVYNAMVDTDSEIGFCRQSGDAIDLLDGEVKTFSDAFDLYLSDDLCHPAVIGKMYVKNVIDDLRFDTQLRIGEDYVFNAFAFKKAKKSVAVNKALYYYENRVDSAVHQLNKDMFERYKNTKFFLESGILNRHQYEILIKKYAYELVCIAREILKSDKKYFAYYDDIAQEIKQYFKNFIKLQGISAVNKICLVLICVNKNLFKQMYLLFKR